MLERCMYVQCGTSQFVPFKCGHSIIRDFDTIRFTHIDTCPAPSHIQPCHSFDRNLALLQGIPIYTSLDIAVPSSHVTATITPFSCLPASYASRRGLQGSDASVSLLRFLLSHRLLSIRVSFPCRQMFMFL